MKYYILLFAILIFSSCNNMETTQALTEAQQKLAEAEAALTQMKQAIEAEEEDQNLIHLVYFKLKQDADQDKLIEEIHKLKAIEVVQDLEIGKFEDLGDQRALSDYQLVMTLEFKNKADYQTYQQHEIHLALKANTQALMAGPPATYDYFEQ